MPAFRLPVSMLRVITTGSVTKGPPSPGQHLRTGSMERSISSPRYITSWQGAFWVFRGKNLIRSIPIGRSFASLPQRFGRLYAHEALDPAGKSVQGVSSKGHADPALAPESVGQDGKARFPHIFEQQGFAASRGFGRQVGNVRNLQVTGNRGLYAEQLPRSFQLRYEFTQVLVCSFHLKFTYSPQRRSIIPKTRWPDSRGQIIEETEKFGT